MEYFLVGFVLCGIAAVIRALTADRGPALQVDEEAATQKMGDAADALMSRSLDARGLGPVAATDASGLATVLGDLFERLGLTQAQISSQLERLGLPPEGRANHRVAELQPFRLRVSSRGGAVNEALERALLVGIHIGREGDDYARVGDEYADPETLQRKAEAAEEALFGDGRREAYALLGKVTLVLQDMLEASGESERTSTVRNLLRLFGGQMDALQQEMAAAMARVPDSDALRWGDSRDRRRYYFKMGVTNSLRRSNCLESLGRLYWLRGVNFDVTEAFDMAAEECPVLAASHLMDIDRLLALGPSEVRGMVEQSLPEPNA